MPLHVFVTLPYCAIASSKKLLSHHVSVPLYIPISELPYSFSGSVSLHSVACFSHPQTTPSLNFSWIRYSSAPFNFRMFAATPQLSFLLSIHRTINNSLLPPRVIFQWNSQPFFLYPRHSVCPLLCRCDIPLRRQPVRATLHRAVLFEPMHLRHNAPSIRCPVLSSSRHYSSEARCSRSSTAQFYNFEPTQQCPFAQHHLSLIVSSTHCPIGPSIHRKIAFSCHCIERDFKFVP